MARSVGRSFRACPAAVTAAGAGRSGSAAAGRRPALPGRAVPPLLLQLGEQVAGKGPSWSSAVPGSGAPSLGWLVPLTDASGWGRRSRRNATGIPGRCRSRLALPLGVTPGTAELQLGLFPSPSASASPRPVLGRRHQPGRDRVVLDVASCHLQMTLVPDVPIPVVASPQRPRSALLGPPSSSSALLAPPVQPGVDASRRKRFPALHDSGDRPGAERLHQHMDMVRHHRPREQPLPFAVEVQ